MKRIKEYKNENGEYHRTDGPAIERSDGTKEWWINGERHRTDGPAIEYSDGTKFWFLNGERHRTDGPAIEWDDGTKEWYLNDKKHRANGPAVEWSDGTNYWYLSGEFLTETEYLKATAYLRCSVGKLIYSETLYQGEIRSKHGLNKDEQKQNRALNLNTGIFFEFFRKILNYITRRK